MQEGDAAAVGKLDGPLQELGAQLFEAPDVRFDIRGVEAEVLEAEVRGGVSRLERLARAGTGDVHGHAAVHALAADEAVPEHPRLVVDDLEVERPHVPLGGAAGIRGLQVDVVDPVCHDASSGLLAQELATLAFPITSVPVVRSGSTAVMVSTGYRICPAGALLDLLDLDDEIAIGELSHGEPHPIAPAQLRVVQQRLRLSVEGHLVHLIHESWSGVMVDEHEGVSGAGLVDSRDAIQTAPGINITPGTPDAGGEARGEEEEERGDGPAGGGRHHAGADRLRLARRMMLRLGSQLLVAGGWIVPGV